jgi:hypothetical protein
VTPVQQMPEAVLILAFNRPEHLNGLIERVRLAQPPRLYLAVDGPRTERVGEAEAVRKCQEAAERVDWPCQVRTLFQASNLGCGLGVSTAIGWFFEHEERGIILEDDILPDPSFFPYCQELLDRYEADDRVFAISGCNYVPPEDMSNAEAGYRFSRVPHIWGWATWRRSWAAYQLDIAGWRSGLSSRDLWLASGRSLAGYAYWTSTFELMARKQVDTWDAQLVYASMASGGLTATSNVNLVQNVGFGDVATHTVVRHEYLRQVEPIRLPTEAVPVEVDERADAWTRRHHFKATVPGFIAQGTRYVRRRLGRHS